MTRLEKARELHPVLTDKLIIAECPEYLLPIQTVECPITEHENSDHRQTMCELCWNKEYKEGEQS
jgi:hypothetical protein